MPLPLEPTPTPATTTTTTTSSSSSSSSSAANGKPPLTPEMIDFATRMFNAARAGDLPIFQQALPAGLPANMTNDKGDTLIMLAAYHDHAPLVRLLLAHGADPNTLNDRAQSPLAGAIFKQADEVVEALLDGGADVDAGQPSAREAVGMFRVERWRERVGEAPREEGGG